MEDDSARRRKRDPGKVAIAARLRQETPPRLKAIAVRLSLGSPTGANARPGEWLAAQGAQGQTTSPRRATARNRKR